MIEAIDLTKAYRKQKVLGGVSFTLGKGRILGILGPNGAGKTTLIRILALLTRPDGGSLKINGFDAAAQSRQIRPLIGYVPQDIALFEDLSVRDNLMCWSEKKGREAKKQAERLINELNLSAFAYKKISALSGGMKRRANLAVALLDDPGLLILDEPLVGVDIEQRQQITESLKKLALTGMTQIIASHHVDEIVTLADEIMVIKDGLILFLGTSKRLIDIRNSQGINATLEEVILNMLKTEKKGEGAQ